MYLHLSADVLRAVCLAILRALIALGYRVRRKLRFTGAAIGNALQILHVYVDPRVRYCIVQRLEGEVEDDEEEDDRADPGKHFERQLRSIRRGEQVDRLTIRIKDSGE
jgi:hypothetical protein